MSEFLSVLVELLVHALTSLTERLARYVERKPTGKEDTSPPLQLQDDFTHHDPEDTICEEFENPENSTDPTAWKQHRPSMKTSLKQSAWFAFLVTVVTGGFIGLGTLLFMYYIISVVYIFDWKPMQDPSYPEDLKRRRIVCESYQSFFLYFWQPMMLCMVFKWPILKDVHLLTVALVGAAVDLGYRFFLAVYELYYPPWIPYPLNVVFMTVVLVNSISIGRNIFNTNLFRAILLAFKLCAQFITGAPMLYLCAYVLFPWFAHQEGFLKFTILALAILISIIPKEISRQCVLGLNGVNHPGTSYVLVATAFTSVSIVYRFMQAEFKSLLAFIALSIGHGMIHLIYELITILKERYSEKRHYQRIINSELDYDSPGRSIASNTNTPRSQRLAADLTIHDMMSSSVAIVLSVGIIQIYGFIHQDLSIEKIHEMIGELVTRIVLALFIEFLFNIVSVMILTRRRNVPVLRVWTFKWRSHLLVCVVTVLMIVTYSTDKVLVIIRARYVAEGKLNME